MNKSQPEIRSNEPRAPRDDFWLKASESSLNLIWDNSEDDVFCRAVQIEKTSRLHQQKAKQVKPPEPLPSQANSLLSEEGCQEEVLAESGGDQ